MIKRERETKKERDNTEKRINITIGRTAEFVSTCPLKQGIVEPAVPASSSSPYAAVHAPYWLLPVALE